MKTILTAHRHLAFIALFLLSAISIQAQDIEVKGIVKGKFEEVAEALPEVNIYLKNTNIGTSTDRKGEFTFPRKLKIGDILVFSYLGFKKKEVTIQKTSTYLNIMLQEDNNVLLGATNTNKRYKSKRKNR